MANFKFHKGEIVTYNNGVHKGYGQVLGVASTEMAVIGCLYILQDMSHTIECELYPFDCFACQECHITKVDK